MDEKEYLKFQDGETVFHVEKRLVDVMPEEGGAIEFLLSTYGLKTIRIGGPPDGGSGARP